MRSTTAAMETTHHVETVHHTVGNYSLLKSGFGHIRSRSTLAVAIFSPSLARAAEHSRVLVVSSSVDQVASVKCVQLLASEAFNTRSELKGTDKWAPQMGILLVGLEAGDIGFDFLIRFEWGYAKKDCTGPLESALFVFDP